MKVGAIDVRVPHISGGRQVNQIAKNGSFIAPESSFEKKFVLDKKIDSSKMTASLHIGLLQSQLQKHVAIDELRKLPIVQGSSVDISGNNGQHASYENFFSCVVHHILNLWYY